MSSTVLHPNGSFSSFSGGTDTDRLIVGSRQQLGNYVSVHNKVKPVVDKVNG
ncbi:hypothetical protein [Streptomyces sp. NPDC015345]|uniref:hypothetical protein n=1 Tax=Streptomyces sp. NPDC015345 TaxID=3364953 RepID=UPI0036FA0439